MSWPGRLLLIVGVLAALYFGRELLAPLALAMLLTVASLPLVTWLERRGVPRIAAVLLVLLLLLSLVALLVYVGELGSEGGCSGSGTETGSCSNGLYPPVSESHSQISTPMPWELK